MSSAQDDILIPQPPADLAPDERRRALRLFHFQVVSLTLWWVVSQPGSLLMTDLAIKYIGFTRDTVGLMSTFLCAAGLVQLGASYVMNRIRNKRAAIAVIGSCEMLLLTSVLLLPSFLPSAHPEIVRLRCALFLIVLFVSGVCLHLVQPVMSNWLSTLVPRRGRGRYLSTRMLVMSFALIIAGVGVAQILHYTGSPFVVIATLMLIGAAAGIAGYVVLWRTPMPAASQESHYSPRDFFGCFRHRPFRRFLVFAVLANAPFALACAWYAAFFLEEVGLTRQQMSIYGVAYSVVRLLTFKPIGTFVDRYGTRAGLRVMVALYAAFFAMFFFFTQATFPLVVVAYALAGLADAIFGVAMPSAMFHALPEGRTRAAYFALERTVILAIMGLGPLLVSVYFRLAGDFRFVVLGFEIEKFRLLFVACGVMILATLAAIHTVPDTHDVRFRDVLIQLYHSRLMIAVRRPWRLVVPRRRDE